MTKREREMKAILYKRQRGHCNAPCEDYVSLVTLSQLSFGAGYGEQCRIQRDHATIPHKEIV